MCNLYAKPMPPDAMRDLFRVDAERVSLGSSEPLRAIFLRYGAPI